MFKINFVKYVVYYELIGVNNRLFSKQIIINTIHNTIDEIIKNRYSIGRFGDGEIRLMNGKDIEFQKADSLIKEKLIKVFSSNESKFLIGLPDVFRGLNLYKHEDKYFWMRHFFFYNKIWKSYIEPGKHYGNAFITRPYMIFKNKSFTENIFKKLQQIWKGRDVVLVEGYKTRMGYKNDLFEEANSISRILCPSKDAFFYYDEILKAITQISKEKLVLISLGPTATILAFDCFKLGFHAIDIGHVDIEYEWFLRRSTTKVSIPNKYTNEANCAYVPGLICDINYEEQVIQRIGVDL